ncbi:MAG TPA: carbamoyltransferase HypF [Phycisphaerae bacterium]|nr:carbamoyltransferase HypF [Phycisphaerae bacterium]
MLSKGWRDVRGLPSDLIFGGCPRKAAAMERRAIAIRGTVQGVGFRPFVYGLATKLGLRGFVKNQTSGVWIEVEGESAALDQFLDHLRTRLPPLARIDDLSWQPQEPRGDRQFSIEHSQADAGGAVVICPDVATCDDCLGELNDPKDRRYHYPFLNCTNCGPRLTIVKGAPYDRVRTTMAAFPMCDACRAEYEDPADRRFHAQPVACPACGPSLTLLDEAGKPITGGDPLRRFVDGLNNRKIGAMKGLGGYHLICDARDASLVDELRRRKQRDERPFAIMVGDVEAAGSLCEVGKEERDLLLSPRRPIVLLRKQASCVVAEEVAPGNPFLGVMLPYTPLHHLLLKAVNGIPLVMTSGNRSDEPIAYQDDDALARLNGIADLFLVHNRPIHVRCDDSVTRIIDGQESLVRRSRGYAPEPIRLPFPCSEPILAVGGQLKGTFALGRGDQAFLSHHMGDLDHYEAYRAFQRDIELYQDLFAVKPAWLVHDLHPDYASTRYALARQAKEGLRCIAVQHHYVHMAACLAENGLDEPAIGVSMDGTGYGTDGAIWGGEFLVGDYTQFRRAAHLRYVGLPGGDQAIHEPWRMALSYSLEAGCGPDLLKERVPQAALQAVQRMLERKFNTPQTSSAGRLFDAVASLAGVRDRVAFEGQAAMQLEWLATPRAPGDCYPFELAEPADPSQGSPIVIDTRPLIRAVIRDVERAVQPAVIARRFHSTMVEMVVRVCKRIRDHTKLEVVTLSGGTFMNALLTSEVTSRLQRDGFRVYRHRLVPPNDGGLSLGQVAIAARRAGEHRRK